MDSVILELFAFGVGAVIGSFLNVCIYRLPKGLSVVSPPSSCPNCQTPIRPIDNIPILSYLLLRGRCHQCQAPISMRYPAVELLTGLLAVATFLRFGLQPALLLYFVFVSALLVITFIDIDYQIIPDSISIPGIGVGLTATFFIDGTPSPLQSAIGILVGGGILYVVATAYEWITGIEGMGFGDVKLLAMIGAFLGWRQVPIVLLAGSLTGSIIGISLMVYLRQDRKLAIPFGPFLAAGAVIALFFGERLIHWYIGTMIG